MLMVFPMRHSESNDFQSALKREIRSQLVVECQIPTDEKILSPEFQTCFAERQFAGPTNRTVELPPEIAQFVPYRESVEAMYFPDTEYVARHLPEWTDRWNREIAR
jgi:hypothetical protein